MTARPLISVVIPFFNIEECIDYCLDSVLTQTFTDYEVICIDDGSADGTAAKLDVYAANPRVKVFHIPNGGPGAARNYGVSQAGGEWVAFVDGDDLVSPFYLESLVEAQRETGADMVVGHAVIVGSRDEERDQQFAKSRVKRVLMREEAVEELLYQQVTESPWAKLVRKKDIGGAPFPTGWYEDVAIAGELYLRMSRVAVLDAPIYGYVMNDGSVTHRKQVPAQEIRDFVRATDAMLDPIEAAYPDACNAVTYRRMLQTARLYKLACNAETGACDAKTSPEAIAKQMKDLLAAFEPDDMTDKRQLWRFRLLATAPRLYNPLFALYERITKGVGR